ncbi:MAG: TetR/AcrR family transcriptional regulator [Nevskiales bacterium]
MPRDGEPTRQKLLDAGEALAARGALALLRVDDVVAKAKLAKGTFYVHFNSRTDYLTELHRRFHEQIAAQVDAAALGQTPSLKRLLAGSIAYLDACREQCAVKALLIEARVEPEIQAAVAAQNLRFSNRAAKEFAAAGWPAPQATARLWVAMVAEAALAEAERGQVDRTTRKALAGFLEI